MARIARIVVPGLPHHVTQRGNRREQVFFSDDDYLAYMDLLAEALETSANQIWAWCLMPNHVHLIVVPDDEDGIRATVSNAHRRYAARINARNRWTGHFWQGRYGSVVMDEAHLHNALAYVTLNPVRAGLVERPEQWRWSSVHAHLAGRDDAITTVAPVLSRFGDFAAFLEGQFDDDALNAIRRAELIGRPIGSADFIAGLEEQLGRPLAPRKRGRKAAAAAE